MTGDQTARLIYLGLLLAVIGGFYMLEHRKNLGRTVRFAAIWGLIFLGAIVVVGLWDDVMGQIGARQSVLQSGEIEVPVSADGHFYLTLTINGVPVRFVIDTGASEMVLTGTDARRVGIDPASLAYLGRANTANGEVATASVWLGSVRLGDIQDTDFRASVNNGEMDTSLLGMSYISLFEKIELTRKQLTLRR